VDLALWKFYKLRLIRETMQTATVQFGARTRVRILTSIGTHRARSPGALTRRPHPTIGESHMPAVDHDENQHRFEARLDGLLAVASYQLDGDTLTLLHTEVPRALRGRGVGNDLARAAFEYSREHQLKVVPRCPFMAAWLRRHPEYRDLQAP
jgi:predicted GNAT family acetyltransferase